MPEILRWLGTPSWTLSQQCTIFSETRRTSSVFAIYVLVAFVVILGSLHAPRTDGHKLEEHWKDTVQRKKVPTISPYEQRRLRGLHSPSWSFQKGSNHSRTSVKKRGRADRNILQHTNDNHTKVSWLHPKDEDLNSYKQGFNFSTGNQHVEIRGVANSTRSSTSDYGSQKWQTVNTQPFRLLVSHTSLRSTTRQPLNPIRKNATVLGSSLYDPMKNHEKGGGHEDSKKTQLEIHDVADKLAKSHEDIFTPQILDEESLLTKRKSTEHMATRASFWQSRDTPKASAPAFYPRSTKTSASATNRKGAPLKENDRGNDNVAKSTLFRPTISSRKETGKSLPAFQRSLSPEPHLMEPGRNRFSSNDSSSVSPMQQFKPKISPKIDLGTTIGKVSSNKPVIGLQSTGKSMLLPKAKTLKGNSTEMLTRNSENRNLDQDKIIDPLKSSWFLFSSKQPTKSRTFQNNHVTRTPAEVLLTLSTKLKHRKDLSSLVRAADKPFVSPLSPVSLDMGLTTRVDNVSPSNKSILKKNKSSNVGTSSPAPMTSSTQTERKKRKRKKSKNKRRQRTQKTSNKKLSSNLQGVSVDKDMSTNNGQRSTTKKEIDDADTSFKGHYEQRLDKPGGSSAGINTSMTQSKTSLQGAHGQQRLNRRPASAIVDSDLLDKIDYSSGSTDDRLTRLTWPGKSQSESTALGTDRKDKLLDSNSKRHTAEDMRRLFKTGLPLEDRKEDSPSEANRSPSIFRFIPKRKKGNTRERKNKNSYFQETKFPNFDSSASSGRVPITKDSSRLHFAKIATVLKTTVKRSARTVGTVTQTPNKKKNALNSKRWKFQLRKQKYKTNGFHIPNRETRIEDKTQSSANSDSVKSKSHSLFDHDEVDRRTNRKTQTNVGLTKQATDSSSLYPFVQANMHTLTLKTSSPLSENQPASSKMVSATSSPSIRKFPSWQRSTQIELYKGKESRHATTAIYDQHISGISTSLPLAFDKKNPNEKKLELFVTQAPNSVINNTTQVSSHFSSRIIRGTDESKSSPTFSVTASSDRNHDATSKTERKPDSSNEKVRKKQLPSTFVSVHSQNKSTTLSSEEIISVHFTEKSTASPASSQLPAITSKSAQHVTTSKNQAYNSTDNTYIQNVSLIDHQSSLPTSPSTRKNSSDYLTLHKEYRQTNKMNSDGFAKEQSSRSSIRQESDDTFRDTSRVSGFRTSTPFPAIWTFSTQRSKSNQQSSQKPNTKKLFPSMKSTFAESVVTTHNPNLVTSRLFATTTKTSDLDYKIAPSSVLSHKEQQSFFHPTTSSTSSFLTSSTSKSTLPLLSTTTSLKTQSSPTLPKAKLSSPSLSSSSNDIQKIVTDSPSVRWTPNTSISILQISSVSNGNQKSQHRSTTKPLTKLPQSTKNKHSNVPTSTMSSTNKIITSNKNTLKFANSTKKPFKANPTTSAQSKIKTFITTPGRKSTKKKSMPTLSISPITITEELISTTDSLKPKYDQTKSPPPPDSLDYEELLVKCKVKLNTDINGSDFINKIKNGLVSSYLEGRKLLQQRKSGSINNRRKREAISYVLEQNIGTHAVDYDETEGIEAKLTRQPRRDKLVEIYFQMLEYGSVIATDTAIKVFSQLQITEISVNLKYPIFHQIEAIKHMMFQSQHPLKPSMTNWLMVTIAAPSIPVLCVICILLTSWYRNHIRLRRKAMAEISRGSHYAESLADVGLEIDMEKGEIVSRAGSTSVLWTDITAGDTLERMGMAGDFPNADCVSSRSNSWNARGDPRTSANPGGRGLRQSPVAKQCQRNGKYVKKKHSVSSFHFENNLEDEWLGCLLSTDYTDPVEPKKEWLQLQTFQKYSQANNEQNRTGLFNPLLD